MPQRLRRTSLAQQLRAAYPHPDPVAGKADAERLLRVLPTCPVGAVARLGRTLGSWREEYPADFDTRLGLQRTHRGDDPAH